MKQRPETKKGGNTRQKILLAAVKLAARHGFAETSFQMVADEIGLSQSAVMYHFPDKRALFAALLETIIAHNHETVNALMDIRDGAGRRLLKHCLGNVLWARRYRNSDAQVLLLLYYLAGRGGEFSALFARMIAAGRERILAHLLAGTREGLFRITGDPLVAAETLQDALFGAMLYAASAPPAGPGRDQLAKKWADLIAALTGWKEKNPGSLLPGDAA
jgi:AcrR family transcriptional regulator